MIQLIKAKMRMHQRRIQLVKAEQELRLEQINTRAFKTRMTTIRRGLRREIQSLKIPYLRTDLGKFKSLEPPCEQLLSNFFQRCEFRR
tara:strand:+ start:113 stop:376 length:264 start_codon:yes stop_codon:yes gene_type:complete